MRNHFYPFRCDLVSRAKDASGDFREHDQLAAAPQDFAENPLPNYWKRRPHRVQRGDYRSLYGFKK